MIYPESMKRKLAILSIVVLGLLSIPVIQAGAAITPGTKCAKAGLQSVYKSKIYTCIKLGSKLFWDNGITYYLTNPSPSPAPTVTVTATPAPAPTVTITASPKAIPSTLPIVTNFASTLSTSLNAFSFSKLSGNSKVSFYELAAQYLLSPNLQMNEYASYSELTAFKTIYTNNFNVWLSEMQEFLMGNGITSKDRSLMFRIRAVSKDVAVSPWSLGIYLTPNQIWGVTSLTPTPTPTPSPTPTSSTSNAKAETSDLQFIYGTSASCENEVGFARISNLGVFKKKKVIIKADVGYSIEPLDYQDDELLFKTAACDSSKVGSVDKLWRINLGNPNSSPQEVYSLVNQGTRNGIIVDAKIDIASNKTVVLAWINGDQQLVTAESNPLLIWSLARQGWLNAGYYVSDFNLSTGWSLSVYGSNLSDGWKSAYVDWRTEITGIGKVTLRGYGTLAQFQGKGSFREVKTGILEMPYVFSTSQGVYVCADYPTTSGPVVDVENNARCTRVAGTQLGRLATSFAGNGSNSSLQAIISVSDKAAYIFESGSIFGSWDPVKISKTLNLSTAFKSLPGIYHLLSTYEISWDIGELSPTLNYKGFFSSTK
jgi:hypothetical protein